ncbi:NADase-type glycan-binding domain-containing protein [Nocardioides sp.]|uniref:NADase-type glycan-binding domain-containing protein n=1 Tax=Nocardioides sp. TaxID=35761 RepID=UPI003D0F0F91
MTYCPECGHALGTSRFCTQCGRPHPDATSKAPEAVADLDRQRTDTAERPALRFPDAMPDVPPPPPTYGARFPLYADEVTQPHAVPHAGPPTATLWAEPPRRQRSLWPVFAGAALVIVLVVAGGIWLLGSGDDSTTAEPGAEPSAGSASTRPGTGEPEPAPDDPVELAGGSRAEAPITAPPNLDVRGNRVRYDAANMLDQIASTAWRMPGDGTGRTLTFTLPSESVLTRVGLINGYAKLDRAPRGRPINWYERNRRITAVRWLFDDGSTVDQQLEDTRRMQTLKIEPTRTTRVRLRLLEVTAPASSNGRDYTPISEVTLIGG